MTSTARGSSSSTGRSRWRSPATIRTIGTSRGAWKISSPSSRAGPSTGSMFPSCCDARTSSSSTPWSTAIPSIGGRSAASPCWATPRTRCTRADPTEPLRPPSTPGPSPIAWPRAAIPWPLSTPTRRRARGRRRAWSAPTASIRQTISSAAWRNWWATSPSTTSTATSRTPSSSSSRRTTSASPASPATTSQASLDYSQVRYVRPRRVSSGRGCAPLVWTIHKCHPCDRGGWHRGGGGALRRSGTPEACAPPAGRRFRRAGDAAGAHPRPRRRAPTRLALRGFANNSGWSLAALHLAHAVLQHEPDPLRVLQDLQVRERIAIDDDQVGALPLLHGADLALQPQARRGQAGGRLDGLHRGQPRSHEVHQLRRVGGMAVATRVRAGNHAHASLEGTMDGFDVMHVQRPGALADVAGARLAMVLVDGEGRHEEHATLRHHRDQLRFLVEVAAVLDGIDAGLEGDAQAAPTEGVAHDLASERVRLVDEGAHLVQVEGAVLRPVAGARARPARGGTLDDVGARPDHGANDRPRFLHAIGDPVGQRGIRRHHALVAGRAHAVADATDGRHDGHCGEEPRPADQPLLHRDPEPRVEPARVTQGGVAHAEGALDGPRRA